MSDRKSRSGPPGGHRSVRFRLLAIALLPMLVILPLLLGFAVVRWDQKFHGLLITKVNSDLTVARQYFTRIMKTTGERLSDLTRSAEFQETLWHRPHSDPFALQTLLQTQRGRLELDFLYLAEANGQIRAAAPAGADPANITQWPVVQSAVDGTADTAVDIFDRDDLFAISPNLAERARLELVHTPNAAPTQRDSETRGMLIHSAVPVERPHGGRAILVGGLLLNRNLTFIDTINDLVYQAASLPRGSHGTATLFLGDVRISTNVRLFENRRALGTRVSRAVRDTVLKRGRLWRDRAFVVNDWYVSAYEPIRDSFGENVGMLYVGFLEKPFRQTRYTTLFLIAGAFLLAAVLAIPLFLHWARGIFLPLEKMSVTIARVERGDYSARTGLTEATDEIARLALMLDSLLDQIEERNRQLKDWNETLNQRVADRTRELRQVNRRLETTARQLILSEKLAAIGEIAAGIAHEINNPVAVIQGNMDLLRSMMGEAAEEAEIEFRLIDEQIHRITVIVTKLLEFARSDEYSGMMDRFTPARLVDDCLPLLRHTFKKSAIRVHRDHHARLRIRMNRTEYQQVIINLIVNAIHAMPDGGDLTLSDEDLDRNGVDGVAIRVGDTGVGMTESVKSRIFEPFFTTKNQEGTGLGLSISQTLIAHNGGEISVESAPGEGTRFTVWLPGAE
jgi:signal transduction histidine kinase